MSFRILVKLSLDAAVVGLSLSAALVTLFWVFNISGFYDAIAPARDALLALVVVWLANAMLFGTVYVGYALHRIGGTN